MLAHDSIFSTEFYTCCISSTISDGVRTNSMGVVFIRFYVVCADVILNCRVTLLGKNQQATIVKTNFTPKEPCRNTNLLGERFLSRSNAARPVFPP